MAENLANQHRPLTFDGVLGHERYVRAFRQMLREDTVPSCILLAGNSGCGKTTLARIIAAASTCTDADNKPCGACQNCKAAQGINDGPNFMHMDGSSQATREKVEAELAPFLHSSPVGGSRYKVCIADEAQALSQGAKNSLLTLTENLPKRSIFIMTTTDPEAIDIAVRTRSFKVYLPALTKEQLIRGVLTSRSHLKGTEEALAMLAETAEGSMREMWQLVQQIESFNEDITVDLAAWMTRSAKWEDRKAIWTFLRENKFLKATQKWDSLLAEGADPNRLGEQMFNDLLRISSLNPTQRDWVQPIRGLSQAQIIGTSTAWKAALCACAPQLAPATLEPTVPNPYDKEALYAYLFS